MTLSLSPSTKRRLKLWLLPTLAYAVFTVWYSGCGGALSDAEVDGFVARATERGDALSDIARLERFFREDSGRHFLMLNAVDMAEHPPAVEGAPPNADADALMNLYMEHMYAELFRRACHPVVVGDAVSEAIDLVGIDGAEQWTIGALFRYRSRRDLLAIIDHPDTMARHRFKVAALDKTISYPIEPSLYLGDLRLLLALLLFALTAGVDAFVVNRRESS